MDMSTIPIVQTSLNQLQICFDASCVAPGFSWFLIRATNVHRLKEASDIAEGPFKLAEDNIERTVSVTTECSNRSHWRIELMRWHAALEVMKEENARAVRLKTLGQ